MPSTPNLGLDYPAPSDDVDVPYFMQQLAEGVEDAFDADGWQDYAAELRVDGAASAHAGSSLIFARWTKTGRTVRVMGEANVGATTLPTACTVMLPTAAGTPIRRYLYCGQLAVYGSAPPSDQTGAASMTADLLRVVVHAYSGGFRAAPASHTVRWNLVYEVTSA